MILNARSIAAAVTVQETRRATIHTILSLARSWLVATLGVLAKWNIFRA
jgi:hypothetical protein